MTQDSHSDHEASRFLPFLKFLGTLAGALLGLGAILFLYGFLAQKAQFEAAGIPCVFIDYWAYVEIGISGTIELCYSILESPGWLSLYVFLTLALIILLNFRGFIKFLGNALWLFAAAIILIIAIGTLIHQQLQVSRWIARIPQSEAPSSPAGAQESAVPASLLFRWGLPKPVPQPKQLTIPEFDAEKKPLKSVDLWEQIADEIEAGNSSREFLPLRPAELWEAFLPEDLKTDGILSVRRRGREAENYATGEERARRLYGRIVWWQLACAWLLGLLLLWQKVIKVPPPGPPEEGRPKRHWLQELSGEFGWATRWVALPLCFFGLAFSTFIAGPANYGALAMPHLGYERVEIEVKQQSQETPEIRKDIAGHMFDEEPLEVPADGRFDRAKKDFRLLADRYVLADADEKQSLRRKWQTLLKKTAERKSEEALTTLDEVAMMTHAYAPELSEDARREAIQMPDFVPRTIQGYILHYPRSPEEKFLRLLTRGSPGSANSWNIRPVPLEGIKQVRMIGDSQSQRLIPLLRSTRNPDASQRLEALSQMQLIGGDAMLEIFIAGTRDEDPAVVGPSTTAVARYAASLDESVTGQLRRDRALEALLRVFRDPARGLESRGAAVTAIHYVCPARETSRVGQELLQWLDGPQRSKEDPNWQMSGTVITSLSQMRYRDAARVALKFLQSKDTPASDRQTIPTALIQFDEKATSIPALEKILLDPESEPTLAGTAITALGYLGKGFSKPVYHTLDKFLWKLIESQDATKPGKGRLAGAAVSAMGVAGDPGCIDCIEKLLAHRKEITEKLSTDGVRTLIVGAHLLATFGNPLSEGILLEVAQDESVNEALRAVAILGLGSFHGEISVEEVFKIWKKAPKNSLLRSVARDCLDTRADRGSGPAKVYFNEIETSESRMISPESLHELLEQLKSSTDASDAHGKSPVRDSPGSKLRDGAKLPAVNE